MKIEKIIMLGIEVLTIQADEGLWLANKDKTMFSQDRIWLGKNDSPNNYYEVESPKNDNN